MDMEPDLRTESPGTFPRTVQAAAPTKPIAPKTLREFCHPMTPARGAAVAIAMAIPRLKTAVFNPFITKTSLGLNHRSKRGPVVINTKANPRPKDNRSAKRER